MNNRSDHHETLVQFFAGYFNEDWVREANHYEPIVRTYAKDVTLETRKQLVAAIREYVKNVPDEVLEMNLYRDLGCCLVTQAFGMSPREWMLDVVRLLEQLPPPERKASG